MSNNALAEERGSKLSQGFALAITLTRFLFASRLGLIMLGWAAIAFVLRPAMIDGLLGGQGWLPAMLRGRIDALALARTAAAIEWVSFAGVLAIAAMAHARLAEASPALVTQSRSRLVIAAAYAGLMFLAYVAFLWTPASVFTLITHDSFIFFDATYRIRHGLVPSVDFPTALGAATLYLPAFASWLTGSYAGSVELASAMAALALGLACAQAGAARFPAPVTVVLLGIVFLVSVPGAMLAPWGGESQTLVNDASEQLTDNLTYAMFYNRWGWAALIPIFAWLAPRKETSAPKPVELLAFGGVLAFLFYVKLTYFAVGAVAALVYAFINPRTVRTLIIGAGTAALPILVVGLLTGNLLAYVHDVIQAAQISGGRTGELVEVIRRNALDILLSVASLGVLARAGKLSKRDVAVAGFIVLGCLFVINQNGETRNMPALIALAAYGVARTADIPDRMTRFASIGCFFMLAASPLLDRGMLLIDQAYAIRREQTRPPAAWGDVPALKGVYIPERESLLARASSEMTPEARRKEVWVSGMFGRREMFRQGEYMETLLAGMRDLQTVVRPGDSIATLDMTNPFPFLMGARAPKGAWLTMHKDRTISEKVHPVPETLFADTDHVMIAKMSMVQDTAVLMHTVYGPWLAAHYQQVVETDYWYRYSYRKEALVLRSSAQ